MVKKGRRFRSAHEVIGKLVAYCVAYSKTLDELTLDEYHQFSDIFAEDVYEAISLETCVNERKVQGGPAKESVKMAIQNGKAFLGKI